MSSGEMPRSSVRYSQQAAAEPKQFLEIQGGHNDGFLVSSEVYLETIDAFLSKHLPQS